MLSRTRSKCSPSVTILLVKCWHWFISTSDHIDWTRKIFQWLIQKYFNQCTIFILTVKQLHTNKSWRKIFQWLKQKYFNHNRNNSLLQNTREWCQEKRQDQSVLKHQSEDSNFNSQILVINWNWNQKINNQIKMAVRNTLYITKWQPPPAGNSRVVSMKSK